MRIALCADGRSPHTQRWANGVAERGHDVAVVWMRREYAGADLTAFAPAVTHHPYDAFAPRSRPWRWPGSLRAPGRLAHDLSPDLVHGLNLLGHGWTAQGFGRRPLVLTALGSDVLYLARRPAGTLAARAQDSYEVRRTRACVRAADVVFVDSVPLAERVREQVPGTETRIVRFGVELEPAPASARPVWRRRLGIDQEAYVLLSSRLVLPRYGIDVIIRALPRVLDEVPQTVLVLKDLPRLSDDAYRAHCLELAAGLGVEDAVRVVGELTRDELLELHAAADVYVSVPERDGTAVSIFEAMAAGSAVVAADAPGIDPEILVEGETALLVPVGDPAALAEALAGLGLDPGRRRRLADRGAAVVARFGDFDHELDRAVGLYEELVAASARR